jgi:hypothetical protein
MLNASAFAEATCLGGAKPRRAADREAVQVKLAAAQPHKVEVVVGVECSLALYEATCIIYSAGT